MSLLRKTPTETDLALANLPKGYEDPEGALFVPVALREAYADAVPDYATVHERTERLIKREASAYARERNPDETRGSRLGAVTLDGLTSIARDGNAHTMQVRADAQGHADLLRATRHADLRALAEHEERLTLAATQVRREQQRAESEARTRELRTCTLCQRETDTTGVRALLRNEGTAGTLLDPSSDRTRSVRACQACWTVLRDEVADRFARSRDEATTERIRALVDEWLDS